MLGTQDIRSTLFGFWKARKMDKFLTHDPNFEASDWTIVDFDNYLRGSPHVQP